MKVVIFGTGLFYKNRKKFLKGIEIVKLVDNNSEKWGTICDGIEVCSPESLAETEFDYICLMVNEANERQILMQLFAMDIAIDKIINYPMLMNKIQKVGIRPEIIIFGTGVFYNNRKHMFQDESIVAFCDNKKEKWEKPFENRIVINPNSIKGIQFDYICVMTNNVNKVEIEHQLEKIGVSKEKIVDYATMLSILKKDSISAEGTNEAEFFKNNSEPGKKLTGKLYSKVPFEKPLMSVITPYYNAGKYFEQTFNCIMNQTFPWFEWIIVNDGSTKEEDVELLHKFAKRDARIRVVSQANMGQAEARNTGFKNATADIVTQIDADDLLEPRYLEYVYWGLYYNPDAAWTYTWSVGFQELQYLWRKHWNAELLKTENYLVVMSTIRKKAWELAEGYKKEDVLYNEDWRFWLDLLAVHQKPVLLGGYLTWYRRLDNGMLSSLRKDKQRNQRSEEIIELAAQKADGTICAKEYPVVDISKLYKPVKQVDFPKELKVEKEDGKIRLLMILPWMVMGGADKFNYDATVGLSERGYEISIMTTVPSDNNWQYKFAKITNEIYNLPDFLDSPHYIEFIEYYIRTRQIDVLVVTNSELSYYMVPYLRKQFPDLCIIDYVHMEEWYWKAGGHARTSGVIREVLEKTYVCNSLTKEVLENHFGRKADSVQTLYIGVDHEEFDRDKVEPGYVYNMVGAPKERPIILFPCRIHPQKRPFMLLEIAKGVKKLRKDALFVVVGDGPQLDELKREIEQEELQENVICVGRSNNMKECYRDAKLTLICSLKEGLALTAYESCSMGVPVISSDVGGQRDLIDSTVGRLIPTEQSEELDLDARCFSYKEVRAYIDAIVEILSDEERYNELSKNCRSKIEKTFSLEVMKDTFDAEIRNLLTDKNAIKERQEMSKKLKDMSGVAEEMYTLATVVDALERR